MRANPPWFKNWKGITLLVTLVIVAAALAISHSLDAKPSIPPDQVEVIVVRHENEPSFDISPLTGEGSRLLSKCEDVLSNLSAHAMGFYLEDEVAEIREKSVYVEIVFKENYEVPIYTRWSGRDQVPSSKVLFILSGEPPEGYLGEVLFRAPEPSFELDNGTTFLWNLYGVSREDRTRWSIFQELIEMASEIGGA